MIGLFGLVPGGKIGLTGLGGGRGLDGVGGGNGLGVVVVIGSGLGAGGGGGAGFVGCGGLGGLGFGFGLGLLPSPNSFFSRAFFALRIAPKVLPWRLSWWVFCSASLCTRCSNKDLPYSRWSKSSFLCW